MMTKIRESMILLLSISIPGVVMYHHTINLIVKRCQINNDILREWVEERQMPGRHSDRENIDD
jgi:hypothetical protein